MKPNDKLKAELVEKWLEKAEEDFGLAEHLLAEKTPYLEAVGFHCQQAAEKYLKAFLVFHQIPFPKTHDLDELLELIANPAQILADSLREIIVLSKYSVEIRYPGDFPELTLAQSKQALKLARKVRDQILPLLKKPPKRFR